MRRFLALIVLLVPLSASAQDRNWIKSLGGPQVDKIHDTVDADGTLFFGGSKDLEFAFSRAWLLATDPDGTLLLDSAYEDPSGRPAEIVALALGDRLYAGGTVGGPGSLNIFVARLSMWGSIDWQVELEAEGDQVLGDLVALRDGGLLVVGTTRPPGQSRGDGWVVKFDAQGDIAWQKAFRSVGDDAFAAAIEIPGGDYVLAGQVGVLRSPDAFQGWILSLDSDGNVRWQKGYEISSSDGLTTILQIPGGYVALASALPLPFFEGDAWVLEVNRAGGLVDSRLVGDFEKLGKDEFVDAISTKTGGFVALGNTATVAGRSQQLWATEFDNRGVPQWLRQFGGDSFDIASGLTRTEEGDLVLAGSTRQGQPDINVGLIVRTVPGGGGSPTCDLTGTLPLNIFEWIPTVADPVVTNDVTNASLVPGGLAVAASDTTEELLCSF